MQIITDLKIQRRNKQRVSVFLDGEFAFGLPAPVAAGLRIGMELSAERLEEVQAKATVEMAKQQALNFISYRPRSSAEVRKNLREKGYEDPTIETICDWLVLVHLLDDDAFARYWVDQRESFKPRSHFALSQELRQKGVESDVIDRVLQEIDEDASARKAADKRADRWLKLPEDEFRKKLGRYLQSRGFNYGIIRQVCDEIWQEHENNNETAEEQ